MKQYVKDYKIIESIPEGEHLFHGGGVTYKELIFQLVDNKRSIFVLDIGFGIGHLGSIIKSNPETVHWVVDGIDGHQTACYNKGLFDCMHYRNIYHAMAQDLTEELIREYDIICLLDVIEHMDIEFAKKTLSIIFESMKDDGFLFLSTPMFFMLQGCIEDGDLEEHKIGVSATSLMQMKPLIYSIYSHDILVGGFVYGKNSLKRIDKFNPTRDIGFNLEAGYRIAISNDVIIHNDVIVIPPLI